MDKPEKIVFQTAKFDDLVKIVNLKSGRKTDIFFEWFNFDYSLNDDEKNLLSTLIEVHFDLVNGYSEEELKMYFISQLLVRVNFIFKNKRGFFDRPLKAIINGVEFSGKTDFMLATGINEPSKPYFFIQEFKRTSHNSLPEEQLLAEMLVAIALNKVNLMRGAYVIGRNWNFVILEKIGENSYQYFVSKSYDSLDFNELKQIFVCLQAVKLKYCE